METCATEPLSLGKVMSDNVNVLRALSCMVNAIVDKRNLSLNLVEDFSGKRALIDYVESLANELSEANFSRVEEGLVFQDGSQFIVKQVLTGYNYVELSLSVTRGHAWLLMPDDEPCLENRTVMGFSYHYILDHGKGVLVRNPIPVQVDWT